MNIFTREPAAMSPQVEGQPSLVRYTPYLAMAVLAAVVWNVSRAHMFIDDAAITFRYVDRICSGHGFTYNDHERVLGTSNPLYVLVLAAMHLSGLGIEQSARVAGFVFFIASIMIAMVIAQKLSNIFGALAAGILLLGDSFYLFQAHSGMESTLAVCIGLAAILALMNGREVLTGALIGLAVWNKLDAGALALAIAATVVVSQKRIPWKIALAAILVFLPWTIFAWLYFGSPLPNSMITKINVHSTYIDFDYLWIARHILSDPAYAFSVVPAVIGCVLLQSGGNSLRKNGALALGLWFILHFAAFSLLNLGDYYPWYLTVLTPPLFILAASGAARLAADYVSRPLLRVVFVTVIVFIVGARNLFIVYQEIESGSQVLPFEAFDNDRAMAGAFVRSYSDPHEVVQSAFGWPAFELKNPFNDASGLNTIKRLDSPSYRIMHTKEPWNIGGHPPVCPKGYIPLANMDLGNELDNDYTWFGVYGLPDSKIALSGRRFLKYHLSELPPPIPYSAEFGLKNIKIDGLKMYAHPNSGATFCVANHKLPVRVVFEPTFNEQVFKDRTDGVEFQLWADGTNLYDHHLLPTETLPVVIEFIPGSPDQDSTRFSLVTTPGPAHNFDYDWAIWDHVKVIVGDAFIDPNLIEDPQLRALWMGYNPSKP